MKFALSKEHVNFYTKQGFIQFDNLFKLPAVEKCQMTLNKSLSLRFQGTPETLESGDPERLYSVGRDLWRDSKDPNSLFRSQSVCEIVKELFQTGTVRLALTQYLPFYPSTAQKDNHNGKYLHYIDSNPTLLSTCSVQGIVGGLIVCLKHEGKETIEDTEHFLPQKVGTAVFFKPECPMDLAELKSDPGKSYLLVVYAIPNSVYINNPADPNQHYLKKLGYNIGDKLNDKLHPILYR